ncbi:hypothetical protein C6P40_001970 [Pichia californica]|uniref:Protein FMP42 n=1 Tax=Pichia californica TaxID=460514 RepID=A0A9P6WKI2_9ASCO|nr:hypothetical protein C6P42_001282 [[Candida] californica]KAG0687703.1 hypothetical protein C6P40_001970 [[Candida] californica]
MSDSETTALILPNKTTQHLPSLGVRLTQVLCAMVWCLFAAGPVFGFAALKPILIAQGVYKEVCTIETPENLLLSSNYIISEAACVEQDLKLNLMFTLAAVITNATALLVGSILDNFGPRITGVLGSIFIAIASVLLANGKSITLFDGYLVGYITLAFGGPFVFISCFQLSNSFPGRSGLILALLTGCFDTSSALFLFYRIAYQNDYIKNLTLKTFFSYYLIVPLFILLCQLFIMPHESYQTIESIAKISETGLGKNGLPLDPNDSRYQSEEIESIERNRSRRGSIKSTKSIYEEIADQNLKESSGGVFGVLHSKTIVEQFKSPWWYIMCLFTTIQMLRINYFVATISSQMEYYFDPETAVIINKFFDIALPLGGILSIPFIGLILDNLHTLVVLTILLCVSTLIGIFGIIPIQFLQYIGILLLVLYRPFYYTAVSDYCVKVFGYATFGTVYGAIICFSGMMNLFQTLLDNSTHFKFRGNPTPVNSFLVILTVVFGLSMLFFIKTQEKKIVRNNVIAEALGGVEDDNENTFSSFSNLPN